MIKFYSTKGDYGFLSNFYRSPIIIDGVTWKTTEHYYQASKFDNPQSRFKIQNCATPGEAAHLGRGLPGIRPDWEDVKDEIMLKAVRAKFDQHPDLTTKLLATGEDEIIEDSASDRYWGNGKDGTGKNRLGQIHVQVRGEIRVASGQNGGCVGCPDEGLHCHETCNTADKMRSQIRESLKDD